MTRDPKIAAQLLGGTVVGGNRIICPGPGHSSRDRSLSVLLGDGPDGFMVNGFGKAGDDWKANKDHVRAALNAPAFGERSQVQARPAPRKPQPEDDRSRRQALAIWAAAGPLAGSPGEAYLNSRHVPIADPRLSESLRWHVDCPFGESRVGCMVALIRDIITDEPRAIHRTAIDADGRKLTHLGGGGRMMLGPAAGGAFKLTPDDGVSYAVAVGEGIESVLSLRRYPGLTRLPVWAVLSAGEMAKFPILPGVETLWIAVDNDEAGVKAADKVRHRWQEADREVMTAMADAAGQDLNDATGGF